MTPARYDVVFRGKLLPGFDVDGVKSKLMDVFSISEEKAMRILKSSGIALKKNTDEITAKKLATTLKKIGLEVTLTGNKKEPGSVNAPPSPPAEGRAEKEVETSKKVGMTGQTPPGEEAGCPAGISTGWGRGFQGAL